MIRLKDDMEKIGKYKIDSVLGKGGMGIVYKAMDPDIDRVVAIKTIRFDLAARGRELDETMGRFMREAKAAGNLNHPNIITIYDVGREEDLTYIVMQYVKGQSLQDVIGSGKTLTGNEIVDLISPLCEALDYAHKRGIVHRDIKPANILIDEEGKPFLVDFGVARVETATMTQTGQTVGTPSYMAPEQVKGKHVDSRADIFSLGVVLYEMITGERPFRADNLSAIIYKIVNEDPPPVSQLAKNLPPHYDMVVKKALSKAVESRYQTCLEMLNDLKGLTTADLGATIAMGTDTVAFSGPGTESGKKSRLIPILSGALAVLVLAGGGYWLFLRKPAQTTSETSSITSSEQTPAPKQPSSSTADPSGTQAQDPALLPEEKEDPLAAKMTELKAAFDAGRFEEASGLAEAVLAEESENGEAQDYLKRSQAKLLEAEIAPLLRTGIAAYQGGDFSKARQDLNRVLQLDKENSEAQKYYYLADTEISRAAIQQLAEKFRKAEESKDLVTLLNFIGSSTESARQQSEYRLLFNGYDDIQSIVNSLDIKFTNLSNATATFSHLLTAVYKRDGKKKVVFEGSKTWSLRKQGGTWKIMGIN